MKLYSGGGIQGVYIFVKNGSRVSIEGIETWYVELNSRGLPVGGKTVVWISSIIGSVPQTETYTYEYLSGNLSKMTIKKESFSSNITTTTYTYDNKRSPF